MKSIYKNFMFMALLPLILSCSNLTLKNEMNKKVNPAIYFEIPVSNMARAKNFYQTIFGYDFISEQIHGNEMALLPFYEKKSGITGALAKGKTYKPSLDGTLIYLYVKDIEKTINLVKKNGGKVLFPRTKASEYGYVAEIKDSEGNRVGLSEIKM